MSKGINYFLAFDMVASCTILVWCVTRIQAICCLTFYFNKIVSKFCNFSCFNCSTRTCVSFFSLNCTCGCCCFYPCSVAMSCCRNYYCFTAKFNFTSCTICYIIIMSIYCTCSFYVVFYNNWTCVMSKCINYFLCYDNCTTNWTMFALCKTCCSTCRSYCCINYFCMICAKICTTYITLIIFIFILMTKCINYNCFTTEFCTTFGTINNLIIRTYIYTIRC